MQIRCSGLVLLTLSCGLLAPTSLSAASTPGTATATLNSAIQLFKVTDMNFGTIVPSATPGTVVLAPSSSYTSTGGLALVSGTPRTAAAFWVYGQMNRVFTITLPTQAVEITNGSTKMTVNTFTSDPSGTGILNFMNMFSMSALHIGAKLQVGAFQEVGVYTGTFDIAANYQ